MRIILKEKLHHCTGCSHSQVDGKAVLEAVRPMPLGHRLRGTVSPCPPIVQSSQPRFQGHYEQSSWWCCQPWSSLRGWSGGEVGSRHKLLEGCFCRKVGTACRKPHPSPKARHGRGGLDYGRIWCGGAGRGQSSSQPFHALPRSSCKGRCSRGHFGTTPRWPSPPLSHQAQQLPLATRLNGSKNLRTEAWERSVAKVNWDTPCLGCKVSKTLARAINLSMHTLHMET